MTKKAKPRKPRPRTKTVDGERYHVYRCVVERCFRKEFVVEARSQDEAESKAYDMAWQPPWDDTDLWREQEMEVRDCTSMEMTDGTWAWCNHIKKGDDNAQEQ